MRPPSFSKLLAVLRRKAEVAEGADCERWLRIVALIEAGEDVTPLLGNVDELQRARFIKAAHGLIEALGGLAEIDIPLPDEAAAKIDTVLDRQKES